MQLPQTLKQTQANPTNLNLFRLVFALFFLIYTYVVARGLIPMPDETPRIKALGVFCIAGGFVVAFHFLTSSYRLFLVGTWFFIPIAIHELQGRVRFLEMMLEPYQVEKITLFALHIILLALLSPLAMRSFTRTSDTFSHPKQLLLGKGIPF